MTNKNTFVKFFRKENHDESKIYFKNFKVTPFDVKARS